MKKEIKLLFISAFLIFIDQLAKYTVRHSDGFYICNKGIAFGLDLLWAIVLMLILAVFFIVLQIFNKFSLENWKLEIGNYPSIFLPITLILAGGISNLIDRAFFGCVVDFINLKFWPVFNLADIYITAGAVILLITYFKKGSE